MQARNDIVKMVGVSIQLQSVIDKVTDTTRSYADSCSELHVPHPRERHMYVSMSVCIDMN